MSRLSDMCRTVADGAASAFDDAPQEFQSVLSAASDTLTESANEIERLKTERDEAYAAYRVEHLGRTVDLKAHEAEIERLLAVIQRLQTYQTKQRVDYLQDQLIKQAAEIERLKGDNDDLREIMRIGMDISEAAEAAKEAT